MLCHTCTCFSLVDLLHRPYCLVMTIFWHTNANMVWRQRTCVTNYVDQQTLKPDDDMYVLPHQRLWTFDVLVCPLLVTERFLLQPLVCGTVFHHTTRHCCPLSPSSAVVLNHISSHFLIPLSDSSLICKCPRSNSSFWTL